MTTLQDHIHQLASESTETDLTIGIMHQVARRLRLSDPSLFDDLYETVIFYTGDWPPDQGWGSSDTTAVCQQLVERLLVKPPSICGAEGCQEPPEPGHDGMCRSCWEHWSQNLQDDQ